MKATFFYDIRFMEYNNEYYSHYGINDKLLQRYIDIFGEITYFGRNEKVVPENEKYLIEDNKIHNFKVVTFKENHTDLIKKVREMLNDTEFAVIRIPSLAGYVAQRECEKRKIPYIVEVVGNSFQALWYHSFKTKIVAVPIHFMMKRAIKNSRFVAYITDNYLQKCYPTKYTSFNGIANVSLILEDDVVKKRLEKLNIRLEEKEMINIGLIGALNVKYKGHETAIKALKIVKEQYPNIKLKFLGQGSKERLEKVCKKYDVIDNVEFCGSLPGGKAVMKWLDDIDIYVQPSITEGHGRSVVEAISRGCITFASNVGGLVDSVNKPYLFKKKNDKELARLIMKAIKDEKYAKEIVYSEYEKIKKYDTKLVEEKRKNAIQTVINYNIKMSEGEKD